jgi:AcrR family transcriptional regulator
MVKEAEISKGLLFHYFKNKKELFLFLYDYCIDLAVNDFYNKINLEERDIIVRLRQISLTKLELRDKYPDIFNFILTAYMEDSSEVKEELDKVNAELLKSNYSRIFDDIDVTKFKEGIDISKAINIIIWTFDGFSNGVIDKAKLTSGKEIDFESAFKEADIYIEMFKNCFYK